MSGQELIDFLKDAEAVIIGRDIFNQEILDALPKLKVISKYGVGLDNLDQEAIKNSGVTLGAVAGTNKRSVAELALSFMIGLCHNIFISAVKMKNEEWLPDGGINFSEKTVGIVGCGNIGKEVVKLLKPFSCKILINDIEDRSEFCQEQGAAEMDFNSLVRESDIVTLHVPLTKQTRDLVNEKVFKSMKPSAFLVNTSRGPVVNNPDLHQALVSGEIKGAAMDVFSPEPPVDWEFIKLPNLMVTPHIGGNTVESVEAMGQAAIDKLVEFYKK